MGGLELDSAVVLRRLKHLAEAVGRLESLQGTSVEQLESQDGTDWTVLHGLQLCIQAVLDITIHLLAGSGNPVPDGYRAGILNLAKLDILPADFAKRMADMAGFRNILVHDYLDVDYGIVKVIIDERLGDFSLFGRHVQEYLQQRQS